MMQEKTKDELKGLIEMYNRDLAGLEQKRQEERNRQQEFGQSFEELKSKVIWPVFVEVGNELTNYNHDFHVTEEKEYTDATAQYHPASITFNVYPANLNKADRRPESTPYVSFVADPYAGRVKILVSTMMPGAGGVVGEHGNFEIEKITPDFVEKEMVEVLKNSLILQQPL